MSGASLWAYSGLRSRRIFRTSLTASCVLGGRPFPSRALSLLVNSIGSMSVSELSDCCDNLLASSDSSRSISSSRFLAISAHPSEACSTISNSSLRLSISSAISGLSDSGGDSLRPSIFPSAPQCPLAVSPAISLASALTQLPDWRLASPPQPAGQRFV